MLVQCAPQLQEDKNGGRAKLVSVSHQNSPPNIVLAIGVTRFYVRKRLFQDPNDPTDIRHIADVLKEGGTSEAEVVLVAGRRGGTGSTGSDQRRMVLKSGQRYSGTGGSGLPCWGVMSGKARQVFELKRPLRPCFHQRQNITV